jgi:sugar phosphate isomerase/epimerase
MAMLAKTGLMTSGPIREWQGKALDLDGYLALVKSWGLETLDIFPGFLSTAPAREVRRAMDRHGLTCACYYVAADLCATGAQAEATAAEAFAAGIENATTLGSPIVFTYGTQHTYAGEDMFQRYSERLGAMLARFDETEVVLVVENAGTLMHKAQDMLRLMDALGGAGLRLCVDTGNFHLWQQDEVEATRLTRPWTIHFHVKDYVKQLWLGPGQPDATMVDLGTGAVRHAEVMEILRRTNYAGTLAFEPHSETAIEPGLRTLAGWLG